MGHLKCSDIRCLTASHGAPLNVVILDLSSTTNVTALGLNIILIIQFIFNFGHTILWDIRQGTAP